eukprot:TRINITY_DN6468_c0_g1_i1.p2 TRINITY_DN6468_c0_g1~~TRINITY_DN6468_c0_g1_i1.p2  ORF type:complete len:100 (+),score=22.29 TRINITY_DN6468_c0_g1_i1:241-540(+)
MAFSALVCRRVRPEKRGTARRPLLSVVGDLCYRHTCDLVWCSACSTFGLDETPLCTAPVGTGITSHFLMRSCSSPPYSCLLYTSPSPRDRTRSRMPSSA